MKPIEDFFNDGPIVGEEPISPGSHGMNIGSTPCLLMSCEGNDPVLCKSGAYVSTVSARLNCSTG